MADRFDHTVLIVDDDAQVGKALCLVINRIHARPVYAASGRAALDAIKTASRPFSLILSDQRMPEMEGSVLLENVKLISPDTTRFLITGHSDTDAVTDAVNKGSIHRYITKPWDKAELIETVKAGLEQHELVVENHKLFALAKQQNAKLYRLNTRLKKSITSHKKALTLKDNQIGELKTRLKKDANSGHYLDEIKSFLKHERLDSREKLELFYAAILAELHEEFCNIAIRNGFEMPKDFPVS